MSSLFFSCLLLFSPYLLSEKDTSAVGLKVTHRARSLQPGEVVLVTVQSVESLHSIRGKIFDREFPFRPSDDPTLWRGLIGIDLQTAPGSYELDLEGTTRSRTRLRTAYPLEVGDKEFPTRRLTVDGKYVNPPAQELPRIRRESKQIREIFAASSASRMWQGSFLSPVPGATTSGFGKRSILNNQPRSPHSGTDFSAKAGTPVNSPNRGKVVLASNLYYSGNTVILDHGDGLYSYFAHLSSFPVSEGDVLGNGDLVGHVGATGRVTGPHLHWSIRLQGTRVDPLSLISVLAED